MNCDELQQLTALQALGVLGEGDELRLRERLERDPAARAELARLLDASAALAGTLPRRDPPAAVRSRVLERIRQVPQLRAPAAAGPAVPPLREGFQVIGHDAPWGPSPLPGSRMKVLSAGPRQEYAMLLVEIGAGVVYPEHDHLGAEEMYVLTGDLQYEGRSLGPGDFLHAEAATHHRPLRSIGGCTALMVVSRAALEAAMGA